MVARIAGTVMKGPVPTMFDMLIETAFSNPNLRGSRACGSPAYAGLVPVLAVTRQPFLREEDARILQIAVDDQQILSPTKRLGDHRHGFTLAGFGEKQLRLKTTPVDRYRRAVD
jgi:hypothetical protein